MAVIDTQKIVLKKIENCKAALGALPKLSLASVVVGQDSAISAYRASQERIAQQLDSGSEKIQYIPVDLDASVSFEDFSKKIEELNNDDNITGIIINKPFPFSHESEVFSLINKNKDIEGVNTDNLGKLFEDGFILNNKCGNQGRNVLLAPTVRSVLDVLQECGKLDDIRGKRITLVGFSSIIGKPLALILADSLATVSITHIGTSEAGDLKKYIEGADIVISAAGVPELIKGEWIKEGAVVIDVGTSKQGDKLVGDVEFEKAKERAAFITPVPGGVGKLTPLNLYYNLIIAAGKQQNK
jgi:methylenetetrahydrofolate dehydrogenase (NADP+) / methenyltetrahydrofolate cyclohydrolase